MSTETPIEDKGAIPKKKTSTRNDGKIIHPNSIKIEAKSTKIHTLLNQIWELADSNMIIVEGSNEDYSQNIQFAHSLDELAVCLQGLGTRCTEKAEEIRQKIQKFSTQSDVHRSADTSIVNDEGSVAQFPKASTSEVHHDNILQTDGNITEAVCSNADTKFANVKSNANNPENYSFQCEKCSKTFRNKSELRNHQGQHIGEFYKCLICSKVFRSSRSFDTHDKSHHSNIVCPVAECNERFKLKSSLTNHMQKHSGQKLKCDVENCTATFTYRQGLIEHITWRHKEKPECECPICKKKFWTPTLMRGHRLRSHGPVKKLVKGYE